MLKKILIGVGVIIVLLIAAVVIVPMFVPVETYKEQIAAQVRSATGREFRIDGDVSFSVLPDFGLEVNDVAFGNMAGASEPEMMTLSRMVVSLKVMPLLSGQIEIDRFVLVDPVINLEVDANGRPNWEFAGAGSGSGESGETGDDDGGEGFDPEQLRLGEIRLQNGLVTYRDAVSGQSVRLEAINLDLDLPAIDEPLVVTGGATWNGQEIDVELRLETPRSLLDGETTPTSIAVASSPVSLSFDGALTKGDEIAAGGTVELNVPSVRDLAAWAGNPLDFPGDGFGPFSVTGDLAMAGPSISFTNARISFDEIEGTGELAFNGGGAVPYISASLEVDRLDLNPYLPPEGGANGGAGDDSGSGGGSSQGWSDDPIDASGLRSVNADLSFSSGEIRMRNIRIDSGSVNLSLDGGRLTMDLDRLQLYGGQGTGQLVLDGSGSGLRISEEFNLGGVEAQPLLTDAADTDWLEGTGNFNIAVTGAGNSERSIVESLNGNGNFQFLDGAINGVNIAQIIRLVGTGGLIAVFDPASLDGPQQTDFAELSGSFTITDGIVSNDDLMMQSPLLRMTGEGIASLPPRTADYTVRPKLVATLEGQTGGRDMTGIEVPIRITGPWDNMSWTPDLAAIFEGQIEDTVEGLVEGVVGEGGVEGLVEGVVGEDGVEGLVEGVTGDGGVEGVVEGLAGGGEEGGGVLEGLTGGGEESGGGVLESLTGGGEEGGGGVLQGLTGGGEEGGGGDIGGAIRGILGGGGD